MTYGPKDAAASPAHINPAAFLSDVSLQGGEALQRLRERMLRPLALDDISSLTEINPHRSEDTPRPNNAPALSAPLGGFSTADVIDLLTSLRAKTQDTQLAGAMQNVETNRIEQKALNQKLEAKLEEWVKKCKEAENSGIWAKLTNNLGTVFGFIATAALLVATVATGGGLLLIVGAALALTAAAHSLVENIWDFNCFAQLLMKCGCSEETAKNWSMAMCCVLAAASLFCSAAVVAARLGVTCLARLAGMGAKEAGRIGAQVGKAVVKEIEMVSLRAGAKEAIKESIKDATLETGKATLKEASKIRVHATNAGSVSNLAAGGLKISSGVLQLDTADKQYEAESIQSQRKELQAFLLKVQANFEDERKKLEEIIEAMSTVVQIVSDVIKEYTDSMSNITAKIGERSRA